MEVLEYEFKNSRSRLLALNYSWHVKSSCLVLAGPYRGILRILPGHNGTKRMQFIHEQSYKHDFRINAFDDHL